MTLATIGSGAQPRMPLEELIEITRFVKPQSLCNIGNCSVAENQITFCFADEYIVDQRQRVRVKVLLADLIEMSLAHTNLPGMSS